ncbi:MAG TPA: glycosyltransferase [Rhodobacteraceae bacterium]|nr:glycosyltransferase [Paracoccaceae bacterium]
MKIIAILENKIDDGGAFNQALNAITQMRRICEGRFEFEVFSTVKENTDDLKKLGISCTWVPITFADKIIAMLTDWRWWGRIQNLIKIHGPFEKKLIQHGCDLVYFLTQSSNSKLLQQTNFITTVFDLCHRDTPEFPEVRSFGKFLAIEEHFKRNLASALVVITESERLSDTVSRRYGIDRERCLSMPMSASPLLQDEVSSDTSYVLKKYNLKLGYFFYPAQFWAHKNHIRILEALVHLREAGIQYNVVFAGGDKGNKKHVEKFAAQNFLNEQVRFLGFVPAEDMRGLYEGSVAVVMPTYFGPTNLPPFEAWLIKRPLVYSSQLKEQAGVAAFYANPDDAMELAAAMRSCANTEIAASLVEKGTSRLRQIEKLREDAEIKLMNRLIQFEIRRRCWS